MNKQTLRFAVLAGLFLVPFIPFLVSSSLFFPFITTKAFAWRVIMEIVFAAWLLLALVDKDYRPKKSPILYAVGAFLVVIGLSNLFGADPSRSFWSNFERMEGYITLLHLGAFFLVIGSVFREADWKRWWNTSLAASALMVLYCLFQLMGAITINQGGVRVDGTFGNASYLAVYMLIHIFIASFFLWRGWKNRGHRYVYVALIVGQLIILYQTATRGAILGLLGGLLIVALLNIRNREEKRVRKASLGILGALILIVGGFFLLRDTSFVSGSPVLTRFASISTEELKSGGRSFVWPMAIEGFKEKPFFGWGQENFIYVFQKHYSPEMYHLEPWFDRAHNIFLDWMVAGGILGIITYLSLYGVLLYLIWRRDGEMTHMEKSILTGLIAAYFFHNFFVFDHLLSYILFFALMAYVYSRNGGAAVFERSVSESSIKRIWLPIVVVLLLTTLYFVNLRPIRTNSALISALISRQSANLSDSVSRYPRAYGSSYLGRGEVVEQISEFAPQVLSSDLPQEEKVKFLTFARDAIAGGVREAEGSAKNHILAGSFFSNIKAYEEAIASLNRARELAPGKQAVYFELGAAYVNSGKPEEAIAAFKEAYDMAPEYPEAKIIYLIGAIFAGDRNLEAKLLSELPEQTVAFEDRLVSAYFNNKRFSEVIAILERRKVLDPKNASTYESYIKQVQESR